MRLIRLLAILFLAHPRIAGAEPLRIAVISDMNGSYGSTSYGQAVTAAIAGILARHPDLVISTGDMVAGQQASPKLTTAELARMWSSFHDTVSDPLARAGIPFLVTPGNHDASAYPGFEAERAAYAAAFSDRRPDIDLIDADGWPFRIAASLQGVLLVGMDATTSGPLAEEEVAWLRQVLAAHAPGHRAVILFGHLPLMPISQGRERDILADPSLFALAEAAGVTLWLSGHQHAFYSGSAGSILFVAQGALGDGPRKLMGQASIGPRTLTWIEIADDGSITVSALAAPDFVAPVPVAGLPGTLGEGQFQLTRTLTWPE